MRFWLVYRWLLWIALQATVVPLLAQETDIRPSDVRLAERPAALANQTMVRESGPSVIYMRSEDGKLIQVIGMTTDDFDRLDRLDRRLKAPDQLDGFTLDGLEISAKESGQAQLLVTAIASVTVHQDTWVRIPLRMHELALTTNPLHQGGEEFFLQGEKTGYYWWIQGEPGKRYTLTLEGVVQLGTLGDETFLSWSLPHPTQSSLMMNFVPSGPQVSLSSGGQLVTTRDDENAVTPVRVVGLGGVLSMSWRPESFPAAERKPIVEVESLTNVTIDGPGSAICEISLNIRPLGDRAKVVHIRLPVGSVVTSAEDGPGHTVMVETIAYAQPEFPDGQIVTVKLSPDGPESVDVRLVTVSTSARADANEWLEVGGMEVLEAVRHSGEVLIAADGDWAVTWETDARRIGQSIDARADWIASFEFYRQPTALRLKIENKRSRVQVEPVYVMRVESDSVQLDCLLSYRVRGAKTDRFELEAAGWTIAEARSNRDINEEGLALAEVHPFVIPLRSAETGEIEIHLSATHSIDGSDSLLRLPRPLAPLGKPGILVVQPADNVRFMPDPVMTKSWLPTTIPSAVELRPSSQIPMAYRKRSNDDPWIIGFRRDIRVGAISAQTHTKLSKLTQNVVEIDQSVDYRFENEPVSQLVLTVAQGMSDIRDPLVTFDGEPLSVTLPNLDVRSSDGLTSWLIRLPGPKIGAHRLKLQYSLEVPVLNRIRPKRLIPLVLPGDGTIESQTVAIESTKRVITSLATDDASANWTESTETRAGKSVHLFKAIQPVNQIALEYRQGDQPVANSTVTERVWVQSWLSGKIRQDRAVFLATTSQPNLTIRIPSAASTEEMRVQVNGRAAEFSFESTTTLVVPLPWQIRTKQLHRIEVVYRFLNQIKTGRLSLELPWIVGSDSTRTAFWQLVVPRNVHLLTSPIEVTPHYRWVRSGIFWFRQPVLGQVHLEQWTGSESRVTPQISNEYLFGSLGPIKNVEVRLEPRHKIVIGGGGIILLLGVLPFYYAPLRHPLLLLVAISVLALVGLVDEGAAGVLGQVTCFGMALLGLSKLIRLFWSRYPRTKPWEVSTVLPAKSTNGGSVGTTADMPTLLEPAHLQHDIYTN